MLDFCTLFDSNYLSRGLAMYESLNKCISSFNLYIFTFDTKSFEILRELSLKNVILISLEEFEDKKLLSIKNTRSKGEYCWTCTPSTILYVLKNYNVDICTYLDADLYFFNSPEVLIDELPENKSVMITEHRYSEKYVSSIIDSGIYCVQFMTFKNNHEGLEVLNWWRNACIEWCYARNEDGRFGDQKYLDDWMTRFTCVYELKHLGGGLAPWNIQSYIINKDLMINYNHIFYKSIFFHFHNLKFFDNNNVNLSSYDLKRNEIEILYKPYIIHLEEIKKKLNAIDDSFDPHGASNWAKDDFEIIKSKIRFIKRLINDSYHIYKVSDFTS